jgi:hypothetical protein
MLLTHRKLLQSKAIAIENDLRGVAVVTASALSRPSLMCPIDISSRSVAVNANRERRRGAGRIPPVRCDLAINGR